MSAAVEQQEKKFVEYPRIIPVSPSNKIPQYDFKSIKHILDCADEHGFEFVFKRFEREGKDKNGDPKTIVTRYIFGQAPGKSPGFVSCGLLNNRWTFTPNPETGAVKHVEYHLPKPEDAGYDVVKDKMETTEDCNNLKRLMAKALLDFHRDVHGSIPAIQMPVGTRLKFQVPANRAASWESKLNEEGEVENVKTKESFNLSTYLKEPGLPRFLIGQPYSLTPSRDPESGNIIGVVMKVTEKKYLTDKEKEDLMKKKAEADEKEKKIREKAKASITGVPVTQKRKGLDVSEALKKKSKVEINEIETAHVE